MLLQKQSPQATVFGLHYFLPECYTHSGFLTLKQGGIMQVGTYMKVSDLTLLEYRALEAATDAMKKAYNPYSKFFVGAAIVEPRGHIVIGSNVENASYGGTICAERAAVMHANVIDIRHFEVVAVIARGADFETKEVTAPCGFCRQVLFEFAQLQGKDISIILATTNKDKILRTSIYELLPLGFGPADLGVDLAAYRL